MEAQSSPEDGWASPEDTWSNLTSGIIAPSFSWAFKALRISDGVLWFMSSVFPLSLENLVIKGPLRVD